MVGIYKITSPNNRVYIGQSRNIETRFKSYKALDCKEQILLYRSFKKYGVDKHTFEIVEECKLKDLNDRERHWQEFYNVTDKDKGLNCVLVKTDEKPRKVSKQTLKRMSESQLGKGIGFKHTEETKTKMSKDLGKLIIDLQTGIYYFGTKDAAFSLNINRKTLQKYLNGKRKNKTNLQYV